MRIRRIVPSPSCFVARHTGVRLLTLAAAVAVSFGAAQVASAQQHSGLAHYQWLDVDGRPLPFQDHATIQTALRQATVISSKAIGRGVAGAQKLVLDFGGTRFHAAFRTVDVSVRSAHGSSARRPKRHRDAAIFEAAAYQVSELLGLGRVPPAVERNVDGTSGTVQIWMEATRPEVELVENGALQPPDAARWRQQKQIMVLFDSLIGNSDRNQGNLLIDEMWNIWLIDHTRAFKQSSALLHLEKLTACERGVWDSLRDLDDATLRERLEPYLQSREISSLLLRRGKLVQHIEKLIQKKGEAAVLFDLDPPEALSDDPAYPTAF